MRGYAAGTDLSGSVRRSEWAAQDSSLLRVGGVLRLEAETGAQVRRSSSILTRPDFDLYITLSIVCDP